MLSHYVIGVAREMHWVHVHPQREKKIGGLIWRGKLSGNPTGRARSQV